MSAPGWSAPCWTRGTRSSRPVATSPAHRLRLVRRRDVGLTGRPRRGLGEGGVHRSGPDRRRLLPGARHRPARTSATPTIAPRPTSPPRRATRASGRIVYLGGFVPDGDELSEHLASRAEVAEALTLDDGPEVVWLGAAMIIGAGSTSFEMLRYVGDRFLVIPMPPWAHNPMDPISISDVLYYLVAAADRDTVPAGAYDIHGSETTTYGELLLTYARLSGKWRARAPGAGRATCRWCPWWRRCSCRCPVASPRISLNPLTIPMTGVDDGLGRIRARSARRPGRHRGCRSRCSLSSSRRAPVDASGRPASPRRHRPGLGGRRRACASSMLAAIVTPAFARPALGLLRRDARARRRHGCEPGWTR